ILVGLLIGLPTWYLAGYRVALLIAKRHPDTPVPALLGPPREVPAEERPGFFSALLALLRPLGLVFVAAGMSTLGAVGTAPARTFAFRLSRRIGETRIALLLSALLAMLLRYVVPRRRRGDRIGGLLGDLFDDALGPVCSIILITGAGGAFGAILTATGIGGELADSLDSLGLPLIVAAY